MRILIGDSVYERKTTQVGIVEKRAGQYLVIRFSKKDTKERLHRDEVGVTTPNGNLRTLSSTIVLRLGSTGCLIK